MLKALRPGGQATLNLTPEMARDLKFTGGTVRVKQLREDQGQVLVGRSDGWEAWVNTKFVFSADGQDGTLPGSEVVNCRDCYFRF